MDSFQEAYKAAQEIIKNESFGAPFEKLRVDKLKPLLAGNFPSTASADALKRLRDLILLEARTLNSGGKFIAPQRAAAKMIIKAVNNTTDKQKSAAVLKMLKHLYFVINSGAQSIWVYSPPKAYTQWIFDEVNGASDIILEDVLAVAEEEVYSQADKSVMANAIQQSKAVAMNVVNKLATPDDNTKDLVKQYFAGSGVNEVDLQNTISSLRSGFQKIANTLNSNEILISDEPSDRNSGGWSDWAFIYPDENMNVIYLQGAWLEQANQVTPSNLSPVYRCVRTIIHELSHKALGTDDVCYGWEGIKLGGGFTPNLALHNADTWAHFSLDVLGFLTGPDQNNVKTDNANIRTTVVKILSLT